MCWGHGAVTGLRHAEGAGKGRRRARCQRGTRDRKGGKTRGRRQRSCTHIGMVHGQPAASPACTRTGCPCREQRCAVPGTRPEKESYAAPCPRAEQGRTPEQGTDSGPGFPTLTHTHRGEARLGDLGGRGPARETAAIDALDGARR